MDLNLYYFLESCLKYCCGVLFKWGRGFVEIRDRVLFWVYFIVGLMVLEIYFRVIFLVLEYIVEIDIFINWKNFILFDWFSEWGENGYF